MAGAVCAVTVGMMLNVLGVAAGAAAIDAVTGTTPTPGAFGLGGGIWMLLASAIGLLLGGLVAARLAGTWQRTDAVLHGLGVWAVTYLLAIFLVGTALSGATVAAVRGAAGAATGVAATAATAATAAVAGSDEDALAAALQRRLAAPADPAAAPREQAAAEALDIVRRRLAQGAWQGNDRARLEQLVASTAGIPQPEAAQRIATAETELAERARQAEATARTVVTDAARATAMAAFWAFAAMLLGLGAASLGAWLGADNDRRQTLVRTATRLS
jgi:hypothetical protein